MNNNNNTTLKIVLLVALSFVLFLLIIVNLFLLGVFKLPGSEKGKETTTKEKKAESTTIETEEETTEKKKTYYVDITKTTLRLNNPGEGVELTCETDIPDKSQLTWSSADNEVASVKASGTTTVVTFVGEGETTITASGEGASDSCRVICERREPEPSPEPAPKPASDSSEYVFPYSNSQYLDYSDLKGLSDWELKVGRNEIYARHHRRFKDKDLQDHFDQTSWYDGYIAPEAFSESVFNEYERYNINFISDNE